MRVLLRTMFFVPVKKKFTVSKIPRSDGDLHAYVLFSCISWSRFVFGFFLIRGTKTGTFVYRVRGGEETTGCHHGPEGVTVQVKVDLLGPVPSGGVQVHA